MWIWELWVHHRCIPPRSRCWENGSSLINKVSTFSISQISNNRFKISWSRSFAYLRMAQRLWIGSMILLLILQARQKRVVLENISMVRRRACCAPAVMLQAYVLRIDILTNKTDACLSASSRMTILCRPGGRVTFFWAKAFILFRTTSMPLNGHQQSSWRRQFFNTPLIRRIEFQDSFLVRVTQQLMSQTVYASRFANPGHTLDKTLSDLCNVDDLYFVPIWWYEGNFRSLQWLWVVQ